MVKVQVFRQVPELRRAAAAAPVCPSLEVLQVLPGPHPVPLLPASPALPRVIFIFISSLTARLVKNDEEQRVCEGQNTNLCKSMWK